MTQTNENANAREEMAKGDEALRAAEELLRLGLFNDAVSRAYYAAFHAGSALLLSAGKRTSKHKEVIASIHRDYVREGKLPQEAGEIITALYQQRDIADYGGSEHEKGGTQEHAETTPALVGYRRRKRSHRPDHAARSQCIGNGCQVDAQATRENCQEWVNHPMKGVEDCPDDRKSSYLPGRGSLHVT